MIKIRKPVTRYNMDLYHLNMDNWKRYQSNLDIEYQIIDKSNIKSAIALRDGSREREFKKNINKNAIGILAVYKGEAVGHGWVKFDKSFDYFFRIGKGLGFLASFFVKESYRGNGIYPGLINELIEITYKDKKIKNFYIGIEKKNTASKKGMQKLNFNYIKRYIIYRFFKMTIPKRKLECNK